MTVVPPKPGPGRSGFRFGQRVPPPSGEYRWVYLWGTPLRVMHWLAALSLALLAATGLYIGRPYFVTGGAESTAPFAFGWIRFTHFAAASVLVMTGIVRVYWLFAGNKFERLPALFPVRPRDWGNMWKQMKYYALVVRHPPSYLGHNPMQQLSYTMIYLSTVVAVVTGFALYGQADPGGIFYRLFNWIGVLLGGMPVVRFIHHVMTWIFLTFIPIHVYLAMRADKLERSGGISSIITGGRFVGAEDVFVDDEKP